MDGPVLPAIPELNEEILTPNSAAFVDIIHSNGGFEPAAVSPVVSGFDEFEMIYHHICVAQAWCNPAVRPHGLLP